MPEDQSDECVAKFRRGNSSSGIGHQYTQPFSGYGNFALHGDDVLAPVQMDGKWSIINVKGDHLCATEFDGAEVGQNSILRNPAGDGGFAGSLQPERSATTNVANSETNRLFMVRVSSS